MKHLIKAVTAENKKRLEDFIFEINKVTDLKELDKWQYTDLLPRGKDVSSMSIDALRAYLIDRKQKKVYKQIEREVQNVQSVFAADELTRVEISVEWKRSRTCGATARAWGKSGFIGHFTSGSIGGCGYDKHSTAVADVLKQIESVLKPLYVAKDKHMAKGEVKDHNNTHREIFGYGSGYGILPTIEGGVGVSCYPKIFESVGYKFETIASGNSFDVHQITKA